MSNALCKLTNSTKVKQYKQLPPPLNMLFLHTSANRTLGIGWSTSWTMDTYKGVNIQSIDY